MSTTEKNPLEITWKTNLAIFMLGLHSISNLFVVYNLFPVLVQFFGQSRYTLVNFLTSVPQLILSVFVPLLIKKIRISWLVVSNFIIQVLNLFSYVVIFKYTPYVKGGSHNTAFALIVVSIMISCCFFAFALTEYFYIATIFGGKSVMFVATGMATAGAITPFVFIFFTKAFNLEVDYVNFTLVVAFYTLVIHVAAFIGFVYLYRLAVGAHEREIFEDEGARENTIGIDAYISVLKKRYMLLILNALVFMFTFIAFPSFLFSFKTSIKFLEKSFGAFLATIFGFAEIIARFLLMFGVKIFEKIFSKKYIYIILVPFILICLLPLIIILLQKGIFGTPGNPSIGIDILLIINYFFIASILGFYGNSITGFICSDLDNEEEFSVACSYTPTTNVLGIFTGSLISHFILQALPL